MGIEPSLIGQSKDFSFLAAGPTEISVKGIQLLPRPTLAGGPNSVPAVAAAENEDSSPFRTHPDNQASQPLQTDYTC